MCPMVRRPAGIELALLGFLSHSAQHGYQIHQMISEPGGLGLIWRIKQSQLYALLSKFEKDGYIRGKLETQDAARPPRRVFQLTTSGRVAFRDWLQSPVRTPHLIRQEFMAKYYFARQEGKEQLIRLIDVQRIACQQWLENFKVKKAEYSSFKWRIYQYRAGQIKAALEWLDTCLESED